MNGSGDYRSRRSGRTTDMLQGRMLMMLQLLLLLSALETFIGRVSALLLLLYLLSVPLTRPPVFDVLFAERSENVFGDGFGLSEAQKLAQNGSLLFPGNDHPLVEDAPFLVRSVLENVAAGVVLVTPAEPVQHLQHFFVLQDAEETIEEDLESNGRRLSAVE